MSDNADDTQPSTFTDADLRGARFNRVDLSGAVMRGVDVAGMDIDSPWICDGESALLVNGVDVAPLVDAELDRRFPGRAQRGAADPEGLRAAWAAVASALAYAPPPDDNNCAKREWNCAPCALNA